MEPFTNFAGKFHMIWLKKIWFSVCLHKWCQCTCLKLLGDRDSVKLHKPLPDTDLNKQCVQTVEYFCDQINPAASFNWSSSAKL